MATKPAMVPESAEWLVVCTDDPSGDLRIIDRHPSRKEAVASIEKLRDDGNYHPCYLYAPDSYHEVEIKNSVKWERLSGN